MPDFEKTSEVKAVKKDGGEDVDTSWVDLAEDKTLHPGASEAIPEITSQEQEQTTLQRETDEAEAARLAERIKNGDLEGSKAGNAASPETLVEQERLLRAEVAKGVEELGENTEKIEALAEDKRLTPPLRERLLSSINTISDKIQSRLSKHIGGSAAMASIVGAHEFLIQTQQSLVEAGSMLADTNKVALAGLAIYAGIRGMQLAAHKMKEWDVKRGVKKGTVEGGYQAASYLTKHFDKVEQGELDIRHSEHLKLYDEFGRAYKDNDWKTASKRVRTEASTLLTQN